MVHQYQVTRQLFSQEHNSLLPFVTVTPSSTSEGELLEDKIAKRANAKARWDFANQREFAYLDQPMEEIFQMLMNEGRITALLPPINPHSRRFNSNGVYQYHSHFRGHSIEERWALLHLIQSLIDNSVLQMADDNVVVLESGDAFPTKWKEVIVVISSEINSVTP